MKKNTAAQSQILVAEIKTRKVGDLRYMMTQSSNDNLKLLPEGQNRENWGKRQHLKKYYGKISQSF